MKGVQMRAAPDGAVTLALMGEVGWDITPAAVAEALKGARKQPVTVSLHSYGGDAMAGIAIHNMLARHEGQKTVIVEGIAASAASLIAMAGDRIVMPSNALMMIHEAWGGAVGDAAEMRQQADVLDTVSTAYRRTYAQRTGKDEDEIAALMAAETWFSADDALAQGFATEVTAPVEVRAMAVPDGRFSRAPAALAAFAHNPPARPAPQEVVSMTESTPQAAAPAVPVQAPQAGAVPATLAELRQIQARAGLDAEWVLAQADAKVTLDQARDAAIDAVALKAALPPIQSAVRVGESHDDPAKVLDAIGTAIAARAMPAARAAAKDDRWRQYAGLRPSEMLIELAQSRGERVSHRDRDRLIRAAFHTTSDFPLLLENAGNKMLEAGYAAAAPSYRRFFAQRAFNDFKAHSFLTAGDFPALQELTEGGQIEAGTISEKRERITPKTYAKALPITRQMLVNDDLGAFAEFGTMIGRRVADYENALAYALMGTASGDGPTLSEGSAAVFGTGAGRSNKASAASTVTAKDLGLGFNAIAAQTSLDGIKLNITPRYLVCSLIQQFVAQQFATSIVDPSAASNVNVFGGRFEVVADANIPNNRWYLFADPEAAPVYVYGYVNGATAPQVRVFDPVQGRDAMVVEVVHDFAVGAIDYRGGYFNSGAAPT